VMKKALAPALLCIVTAACMVLEAAPVFADDVVNLSVPFIDQRADPPDAPYDWNGGSACGAAAATMIVAYHGKLAPQPCAACGTDYSWYVNQQYTNSYGNSFTLAAEDDSGNDFWGTFGYVYGTGTLRYRVEDYFEKHGLVAEVVMYSNWSEVKDTVESALDAGNPVYAHTNIFGGPGHEVVIRGYTDDSPAQYRVNDPYWGANMTYTTSKFISYIVTAHPSTDQTWYLSNVAAGPDYRMYHENTSKTSTTVTVGNGSMEYWIADEPAQGDVTFPGDGNWHVAVYMDSPPSTGNQFTGTLGTYDPDGPTYTPEHGPWNFTGADGSKDYWTVSFNAGSFTIPSGDYLAFWIVNTNDATGEALLPKVGSSNSVVISATSDPAYPVPELPPVVLMATALAALGGYYLARRGIRARTST